MKEQDGAIAIPHQDLSAETLQALVESFVLREGTDYGVREHTLREKVDQVMRQLQRGEACILFDPETQSVTIIDSQAAQAHALRRRQPP